MVGLGGVSGCDTAAFTPRGDCGGGCSGSGQGGIRQGAPQQTSGIIILCHAQEIQSKD